MVISYVLPFLPRFCPPQAHSSILYAMVLGPDLHTLHFSDPKLADSLFTSVKKS